MVWIGGRDLSVGNDGLIPTGLGGWEDQNCIYLDYFGTKGRPTTLGCTKKREIEKKSQWNIPVRGDLMGEMMDTEGLF